MSISALQKARLGMFMAAGVFLLILFFAIPVGLKLFESENDYYCYFKGGSLSGLEQGATVKYRGIPIGKITEITYNAQDIERVKVIIAIDSDFPLKEDMYIQTGLMGITGLKYIEILGGTNEAEILPPGSEVDVQKSLMSQITGKSEVIINKFEILLNNLNRFTHPDSLRDIQKILTNVENLSGNADGFIQDIRPDVKKITHSAVGSMNNVQRITADVESISDSLSTSINYAKLRGVLLGLDSVSTSLKELTENVNTTVKQGREDIRVSLKNLRETTENANDLSRILVENPSLLLRKEKQKERKIR